MDVRHKSSSEFLLITRPGSMRCVSGRQPDTQTKGNHRSAVGPAETHLGETMNNKHHDDIDETTHRTVMEQGFAGATSMHNATLAVLDTDDILGERCATCDGFMCMDCAEGNKHSTCTRSCIDCVTETLDWDQELEMHQIVTELSGLHALEQAIAGLEDTH